MHYINKTTSFFSLEAVMTGGIARVAEKISAFIANSY